MGGTAESRRGTAHTQQSSNQRDSCSSPPPRNTSKIKDCITSSCPRRAAPLQTSFGSPRKLAGAARKKCYSSPNPRRPSAHSW